MKGFYCFPAIVIAASCSKGLDFSGTYSANPDESKILSRAGAVPRSDLRLYKLELGADHRFVLKPFDLKGTWDSTSKVITLRPETSITGFENLMTGSPKRRNPPTPITFKVVSNNRLELQPKFKPVQGVFRLVFDKSSS